MPLSFTGCDRGGNFVGLLIDWAWGFDDADATGVGSPPDAVRNCSVKASLACFHLLGRFPLTTNVIGHLWILMPADLLPHRFFPRWHIWAPSIVGLFLDLAYVAKMSWIGLSLLVEEKVTIGLLGSACLSIFICSHRPCLGSSSSEASYFGLNVFVLLRLQIQFHQKTIADFLSTPTSRTSRSCCGLGYNLDFLSDREL